MSYKVTMRMFQSISAEEGLIAIAYERKLDVYSRVYQVIFSPLKFVSTFIIAVFSDGEVVHV